MAPSKPLIAGILGCLAVGVAASSVLAGLQDDRAAPVTVPVSKYGDQVTYGVFDRWEPTDGGRSGTPASTAYDGSPRLVGTQTFALEGPLAALDRDGVEREAVPVKGNGTGDWYAALRTLYPPAAAFFWQPPDGGTEERNTLIEDEEPAPSTSTATQTTQGTVMAIARSGGRPQAHHQLIDLETRGLLRDDTEVVKEESSIRQSPGGPTEHLWTHVGREVRSTSPAREPELLGLQHQGRTLQLGEELVPLTQVDAYQGWRVGDGALQEFHGWSVHDGVVQRDYQKFSADVRSIAYREWVADHAKVQGRDALAVRVEVTVEYRKPPTGDEPAGEWTKWSSQATFWFSSDSPYPILVQTNRYDLVQAAYVPGSSPIPWDAAQDAPDPDEPERVPMGGARYPTDDEASPLPYALSRALADVEGAPPANFSAWKSGHAENTHLVAAHLYEEQPGVLAWRLLWGVPTGGGYEVDLRLEGAATEPVIQDVGARPSPAFTKNDLPRTPLTIDALAQLWRARAGEDYRNQTPNLFLWGLDAWAHDVVQASDGCGLKHLHGDYWPASDWMDDVRAFDRAKIGVEELTRCHGDAPALYASSISTFQIDGTFLASAEGSEQLDVPESVADSYRAPTFDAALWAGLRPPQIETTAWVTGSLLLGFLALYVAPLAKFAGAHALFAFPGYSKLARERLLDNRVRDELLDAIHNDPGVHATELGRRVQAGWGTIVYHLSVLERNQLVTSLVDGRHKRFFPVGVVDYSRRGQMAVLKNDRTKAFYQAVAQDPGVIQETLAGQMSMSRPAALWHLRRLEEAGLVGRVKRGRKVHYFANEAPEVAEPYDASQAVEVA